MHESAELRELIDRFFRALANRDAEFFERHVWRGEELRLIGSGPEEWIEGVVGFDLLRQQAANGLEDLRSAAEQVEAYSSGDVGWGAAVIRYSSETDRTGSARETFVFHRLEGNWKLIQSHTSFPVPDEDVFPSS